MSKTDRAVAIRDHLLPLLREHGAMQAVGGLRLVTWKAAGFTCALRSPFTRWPPDAASAESYARALAQQQAKPVLPWALDVWHGRKVLSLQWEDAGAVEVASFTRGPWEDEALALP